jgi:hypothetical protein
MTEFTFRHKNGEAYDSDGQLGSERSTAAPPSLSRVTGATASAVSADRTFQSDGSDLESIRKAIKFHFLGENSIARYLPKTEGGEDQAVAKHHMTLEEAEQLLRGNRQVPLKGIEFHRYIVDGSKMWFYRVYHGSPENSAGFLTWRTSPGLLVQDFKDECK